MILLKIPEVKVFMAKLLTQQVFDGFLLKEMELQTFTSFTINGQFHEDFFSQEELEERGDKKYTLWNDVRPIAFSMIKGNKTPLHLKIVFQLPKEHTKHMVERLAGRMSLDDIGGLYINIRFDKGELYIITGTAIKTFTLDKSLEQEWDKEVKNFLQKQGIIFEEE